jgi:hypothetical protein
MATTSYRLQVSSDRSSRLIEIRKPDGTIYQVALGEFGAPILCTCPGHLNHGTCKHEDMVIDAMLGKGIPFRKGGRLVIRPDVGLVEEGRER